MILGVPILKHFRVYCKSRITVLSQTQIPQINPIPLDGVLAVLSAIGLNTSYHKHSMYWDR